MAVQIERPNDDNCGVYPRQVILTSSKYICEIYAIDVEKKILFGLL